VIKLENEQYSILGYCWHCGEFTHLDYTKAPPICRKCEDLPEALRFKS